MPSPGKYTDGFLIPVPKDKTDAYRDLATRAAQVWMDHGALEYTECMLDDVNAHDMRPFPVAADVKEGETVWLSWVVFRDRAHRDEANAKIMEDPRMKAIMEEMPLFDCKRMSFAGFTVEVAS